MWQDNYIKYVLAYAEQFFITYKMEDNFPDFSERRDYFSRKYKLTDVVK